MSSVQHKRSMRPIRVYIPLTNEDTAIGALPNDKLVIVRVQPNTPADGKLLIGDKVVQVNDVPVFDRQHFSEELNRARPLAKLMVVRGTSVPPEVKSLLTIPPERVTNILPRDGFTYLVVRLDWVPGGPKLGLGIKDYQCRVLVSRCDKGSLSGSKLRVGDRVIDVDGTPVSNKDVCREMIISKLRSQRYATLLVERPFTQAAVQKSRMDLTAASEMSPSVPLGSDVREIAARQQERLKSPVSPARTMVVSEEVSPERRATIADTAPEVFVIASDHENKKLRHVKKRK